jgi:alpha-glucosidase
MSWWDNAVGYEVYIRSFADSNGDGVGDFAGLTARLEHLAWLGIDAVWVTPFYPSPQADFGYDVADYTAIDPVYGSMDDFLRFRARARELGLRVMVDLVPNHTSRQHRWFQTALADPDSPERDFYFFRPPAPDGGLPNNWVSHFGGPAWTLDEASGEYYLHLFHRDQPDLDWSNPAVRQEFDSIFSFWIDQGVDGFRIDVAHALMKDEELKDNPQILPLPHDATPNEAMAAFEHLHDHSQDSTKEIYARWKSLPGGDDIFLLGEVYVVDVEKSSSYMGIGGLDLCLFFGLNRIDWNPSFFVEELRNWSNSSEDGYAWTLASHDEQRPPTRFGGGDLGRSRALAVWTVFSSLPGMPFVYQGEELGLENGHVEPEHIQDPVGQAAYHESRDFSRTPMPWDTGPNNGFTTGEPWLISTSRRPDETVAHQRKDPDSFLHLFRDLLATRKRLGARRAGKVEWLPAPAGTFLVLTGDVLTVSNLTDEVAEVELPPGEWSLEFDTSRREPEVANRQVKIPPANARIYSAAP